MSVLPCLPKSVCPLILWTLALPALGQSTPVNDWRAASENRLKGIYEKGDFRPQKVEWEWFPDSTGFAVLEKDPESGKEQKVAYDLPNAQRIDQPNLEQRLKKRNALRSPDGRYMLEFHEQILHVRELANDKRIPLTAPSVDRDVRIRNPTWSPDGKQILFVESDITDVKKRSVLAPTDPSYPEVQSHRFARVGETIERLRIGVVNADGSDLRWLPIESPPEGMYLGQVEWAGNSEEVLVEKLSRFRNRREFLLVNVHGNTNRIYEETNEAWVESSQGKNSGLLWVQNGQAFIVLSEKDGWRQAFLYSRSGKEIARLTPGNYDIIERATVDEKEGWFFFYASPDNGTQKYLCRAPLDGSGKMQRISPATQTGTHHYDFSPDAKWAVHTYSSLDNPPLVELVQMSNHRSIRTLADNEDLRRRVKSLAIPPAEFLTLDIGQGVRIDAWMLRPKAFDPSKKYPVFVYVYGEPHAQTVLDEWGAAQIDFHRLVAEQGYIVISMDNRGTPAPKGAAWRRAIFGSLGPLSTEEQEAALKEFGRTHPYADLSRVGIWGWSGGGSNTLNAMFRKPDSYHVGIAVVPKPQPHLYNAWFQEIYMRTREVNPEGYERAAAIRYAEGLKGKLLMITGSGETNTHIQIIEGLVDRLIELGKPFDYMVYPNRDHGLREGNGTTVHVRMLILRYLLENLPAGPR